MFAISAFVFFRFVFVVGLYCLVWTFVLSYALQKFVEKKDFVYFEEYHTVDVLVLCLIGVLVVVQGSEYVRGHIIIFVFHLTHRGVCFCDCKFSYPG